VEVRIAVDANAISEMLRGDRRITKVVESATECWVPLFAYGELMAGFIGGNRAAANQELFQKFLSRQNVELLCPDEQTARTYGALLVQMRRAGTPIPINDLWIAALTMQHGLRLLTRDRHFERIPQLSLLA
jgi:tRNA(fMet)-specific endonuclease VapC